MENKNQNGRYRVVITDTETGNVELDECYNVIIAGLNGNETATQLSAVIESGVGDICLGIVKAQNAIEQTKAFLVSKGISGKNLDIAVKTAEIFLQQERDGGEE